MTEACRNEHAGSPRAVLITGMHRSGTSALARVLNLCGMELGTELMKPGLDNPTGFWEHEQIVDFNDELLTALGMAWDSTIASPPRSVTSDSMQPILDKMFRKLNEEFDSEKFWGIKDPRLCRLLLPWRSILSRMGVQPRFAIAMRHPFEVAASLEARNGFTTHKSLLLWLLHTLEAEKESRSGKRVIVSYDALLSDWRRTVRDIDDRLDLGLAQFRRDEAQRIQDFLAPGLRHHRVQPNAQRSHGGKLASLACEVYGLLEAVDGDGSERKAELDRAYVDLLQYADSSRSGGQASLDLNAFAVPGSENDPGRSPVQMDSAGRAGICGRVSATVDVAADRAPSDGADGCSLPHRIKVSVVVPVFNQPEHVGRCVDALSYANSSAADFEVVVVDNGSNAHTRELLAGAEARLPFLRVIRNAENRLFAPACNQGAHASNGEVLVFLNSDTEVQPGWLEAGLARLRSSPRAGVVGARLLYPDHSIQHGGITFLDSGQGGYDIWPEHRFRYRDANDRAANVARQVAAVTGACMFVRREVFEDIDGFDEAYGMYFEDVDLCMQVQTQGWEVWYEPAVCVVHVEGASSDSRSEIDRLTQAASHRFFERWGEYVRAFVEPDDLVAEPPADLIALGERALASDERDLARRCFYRAVEADPSCAEAHNNLAVLYWEDGDTARSLRHVASGLQATPVDPDLVVNAWLMLSSMGEYDLARGVMESYMSAGGDEALIRERIAHVYRTQAANPAAGARG
jgi:GT2 family glycosyltransferase